MSASQQGGNTRTEPETFWVCAICDHGGHTCPCCGADTTHAHPLCDEAAGQARSSLDNWPRVPPSEWTDEQREHVRHLVHGGANDPYWAEHSGRSTEAER